MAFLQRYVRVVVWNLSGAKNGQGIGKMLSIAQNGAKQVNRNCD
jgi:hypothetical protein